MLKKLMVGTLLVFSLVTNANETLTEFDALIQSNKGKVIYVDFWASWCIPCKKSFPWMNEMQAKYKNTDFTVLSVNLDANKSHALTFLEEIPATFPVFYDPKGRVAKAFKLKGMPSSFIVDKAGNIVSSHVGFNETKKVSYQTEIEALIKQ
ncbi:TlpA disulfide reductase family protein [Thalassotalea marina]|uniref:Thioredoxin domain-containing protein n=1 Tax=Thalassotalea marina TaxID=1673741 RepID=A0A919BGM3_9GAMM|nr:TlpA disulfide reductase family protein [Thalassotalea marina]GHF87501.1 hypothetical protein GCM10017161_13860 [Thalassotalea marina]